MTKLERELEKIVEPVVNNLGYSLYLILASVLLAFFFLYSIVLVKTTIILSYPMLLHFSTGILSETPPSKYFLPSISIISETIGIAEVALNNSICSKTLFNFRYSASPVSIFVIRPSKDLKIKRIEKDVDKLQAMYDLGVSDCKKQLEKLKEYINL